MESKFSKEDSQKCVKFLNMISAHAEFKLSTDQLIAYFKLLNWAQTELLPKIEANIFEVIETKQGEMEPGDQDV